MKPTYYTPKIEEFRIGFEYEVNALHIINKKLWVHKQIEIDDFRQSDADCKNTMDVILPLLETKNIRVKHLDKLDIESLGWVYTGPISDELPWTYKITHSNGFFIAYLHHYITEENVSVIMITGGEYGDVSLNIKNKSELKHLMTQVGIQFVE